MDALNWQGGGGLAPKRGQLGGVHPYKPTSIPNYRERFVKGSSVDSLSPTTPKVFGHLVSLFAVVILFSLTDHKDCFP